MKEMETSVICILYVCKKDDHQKKGRDLFPKNVFQKIFWQRSNCVGKHSGLALNVHKTIPKVN